MSAMPRRDAAMAGDTNNPFYFNTSHWRAVDGILEGVEQRAGVMVLTGPPGSGKTMLMRAISEGLKESTPPLFLQYASLNFREFVNFLHSQLKIEDEIAEAPNKAVALREFLYVQAKRDETAVVFIDEAHNLEPDVLKMLPKLARFDALEDGRVVGLQFVLIGSPDLLEILDDPDFATVREKVELKHELRFFTREELGQFLKKRLAPIARTTDEPITPDAIDAIGRYTGGSPRLIGMICSHAMLFAAENPGKSIDAKMVEEAAEALMMESTDDPFAHEADMPGQASGPYSEGDLSGGLAPDNDIFSTTETVYTGAAKTAEPSAPFDVDDKDQDEIFDVTRRVAADRAPQRHSGSDADEAPEVTKPRMLGANDSIYAMDPDADIEDEKPKKVARTQAQDEIYTDIDSFDDDYDLDDDFDDDDDDFSDDSISSSTDAFAGCKDKNSKGTSFLQRIGLGRKAKKPSNDKIVGAARKRDKLSEVAGKPTPKRRTKTRVARDKDSKTPSRYVAIAAAGLVVVGGGWAASKLLPGTLYGEHSDPAQISASNLPAISSPTPSAAPMIEMAAAPSVQPVPSFEPASIAVQPAALAPVSLDPPSLAPVDDTMTTTSKRSSGGWGATVVVERDNQTENKLSELADAITEPASGIAGGMLESVERALDAGEAKANDGFAGVLRAASDQVRGLRNSLTTPDLSPEEALARVEELTDAADAHFAARRMIAPASGNAYDSYREALNLDPDHERAQAGIRKLREFYAKKAEGARDARMWDQANGFFETAIAISNLRSLPK